MTDNNKVFSDSYFDSGDKQLGKYSSYEAERFYPAFEGMAIALQNSLPGKTVLDLGCAKGFLVDVLRKNGFEAYGTDISEYAIKNCPPGIEAFLHVCDLNTDAIPFPDATFDTIICMGTLEYVENQDRALKEINRILKKGGTFLMTTLDRVAEGDTLRKFTQKEAGWDASFGRLGFSNSKAVAVKVLSAYVRKINEYDFAYSLSQPGNGSLKMKLAKLVFSSFGKGVIVDYLVRKQLNAGYLMLGYTKQ